MTNEYERVRQSLESGQWPVITASQDGGLRRGELFMVKSEIGTGKSMFFDQLVDEDTPQTLIEQEFLSWQQGLIE